MNKKVFLLAAAALASAVLLAGPSAWAQDAQDPEHEAAFGCPNAIELDIPDQCVAPGQDFEPIDLDSYLPGGAPAVTWRISIFSESPPPNVTLDDGVATITYPAQFVGCRKVKFLASKSCCTYAYGWVKLTVAPSPVVGDIPDAASDPQAGDCDVITFDLDDHLSGMAPDDVEWTALGAVKLTVQIDADTHVATITNDSGDCGTVIETITFRACIKENLRDPECLPPPCPDHCWECDEDDATFTMICDADLDGVADHCDVCPGYDDNVDTDGDGVPDGCDICEGHPDDVDTDGDGVPDGCDICEGHPDDVDTDGDGVPDGCDICEGHPDDVDTDGDGVPDGCDICEGHPDDVDTDQDGVPDGCDICEGFPDDIDTDGDKVADGCDICEGFDDNEDADGDGIPDGCDDEPPAPQPIPCPDCPTPDEMLAVGWFCPSAGVTVMGLLMVGIFATAGRTRRW